LMTRWKLRNGGACKHWTPVSSPLEPGILCLNETDASFALAIMWRSRGSVHYSSSIRHTHWSNRYE
jgi:hypothetical protein